MQSFYFFTLGSYLICGLYKLLTPQRMILMHLYFYHKIHRKRAIKYLPFCLLPSKNEKKITSLMCRDYRYRYKINSISVRFLLRSQNKSVFIMF